MASELAAYQSQGCSILLCVLTASEATSKKTSPAKNNEHVMLSICRSLLWQRCMDDTRSTKPCVMLLAEGCTGVSGLEGFDSGNRVTGQHQQYRTGQFLTRGALSGQPSGVCPFKKTTQRRRARPLPNGLRSTRLQGPSQRHGTWRQYLRTTAAKLKTWGKM